MTKTTIPALVSAAMLALCCSAADYTLDGTSLTVHSGTYDAADALGLTSLVVEPGATLVVDAEGVFAGTCQLTVNGTLDLKGHSISVRRLKNDVDDKRNYTARVVNSSATPAAIALNGGSAYYGAIVETAGAISISDSSSAMGLYGPDGAAAVSSVTYSGTGSLLPYSAPASVKFVLKTPSNASLILRLAEIQLTYQGRPVPVSSVSATAYSQTANPPSNLVDGRADTWWRPAAAGETEVTFSFATPQSVDGYRVCAYDAGGTQYRPGGWDVYARRASTSGWVLMDSRSAVSWPGQSGNSMTNILFAAEGRFGSVFGENSALSLLTGSATALRVTTIDPLAFGTLTGTGGIRIEDGGAIAPGDVSGWTGPVSALNCDSFDRQGRILLSSERGGTEQRIAITNAANIAVANAGSAQVSILVDGGTPDASLRGRLADGEKGRLGLVKSGACERVLETEDCSYSGPTVVAEGTLAVARTRTTVGTVSARYFRFSPTATYSSGQNYNVGNFNWAANEFQLIDAGGNVVPWPNDAAVTKPDGTKAEHGTSTLKRFADNNTATRALVPNYTDSSRSTELVPVTIDAGKAMSFSSYCWYSTRDNVADSDRTPVAWTLEVSDDGTAWKTMDRASAAWSEADTGSFASGANGVERGPFAPQGSVRAVAEASALKTLPDSLLAAGGARDTHGTLKARYFRYRVYETRAPMRTSSSWGWQLAEIGLMKDGERVDWPAGVSISVTGASVRSGNNSYITNLVNNVVSEANAGADNDTRESAFIEGLPSYVTIDAGREMEFDAYSLVTTAGGSSSAFTDRLPVSWEFQVSADGSAYTTVDVQSRYLAEGHYSIMLAYQEMGPFLLAAKFPLLRRGAGDSLGDSSPVEIREGAVLKLATDYERFGTLSGAGTLELEWNAVASVNACSAGAFSGRVAGFGTLAVCGTETQTLSGADISGVKALELDGGVLAGTAVSSGDLSIAFGGGAIGTSIDVGGSLSVSGNVVYALPEGIDATGWHRRIFSAGSIDQASRDALASGTFAPETNIPRGCRATVRVSETDVSVDVFPDGLFIIIR